MYKFTAQNIKEKIYANKKTLFFLCLVILYLCSPLFYYGIPQKLNNVRISPSGKYRVEIYIPDYSVYAFFAYRNAYFIKVYNTEKQTYVYTSMLDDFDAITRMYWPEEVGILSVSLNFEVYESELQ